MNRTIQPAPIRRSVTVKATQARAFEVFTSGISRWWPKSHHIGSAELESMTIEPRAGGRWFARSTDGSENEVGKVLAFEPPSRLVLGWQITTQWKYEPDFLTEVELNFIPEGEAFTRVELEHRNIERFGEHIEAALQSIDGPNGWRLVLQLYADAVQS
jgi:uncharacterized protein YndB with AHSA1/START domain